MKLNASQKEAVERAIHSLSKPGNEIIWDTILTSAVEDVFEHKKWIKEIPYIEWPAGWKVRAIPAFGGAVIRYNVQVPGMSENERVSVYLDCYQRLGYYGKNGIDEPEPYWKVYPYKGDTFRCDMKDTKALLEAIADRSGA